MLQSVTACILRARIRLPLGEAPESVNEFSAALEGGEGVPSKCLARQIRDLSNGFLHGLT